MAVYTYPEAGELMEIEQARLPGLLEGDPSFDLFPERSMNSPKIEWEQMENFGGNMTCRGYNGNPGVVQLPGSKRFAMDPGVYGDMAPVDEMELTKRRSLGTWGDKIPVSDLVGMKQMLLLERRLNQQRKEIWGLLQTGKYSAYSQKGDLLYTQSYAFTQFDPTAAASAGGPAAGARAAWSDLVNSTPLRDLREAILAEVGYSQKFVNGKMFGTGQTINMMLNNSNQADLGGKRREYGASMISLKQLNELLAANDLPEIVRYDGGQWDDTGAATFTQFLTPGNLILIGTRTNNAPVGEYIMTANAQNPDAAPGAYTFVHDSLSDGSSAPVPRQIQVHHGFNGGLAVYFPRAVMRIKAYTPSGTELPPIT